MVVACGGGSSGNDGGEDVPPAPQVTARITATPTSGDVPLTMRLEAHVNIPDLPEDAFMWDLGDGTTGQGSTLTHTYTQAGTFDVVLTVTVNAGAATSTVTSTATITVNVVNQAPVADFVASPRAGTAPLTVSLDASNAVDPDGTITVYTWDLGDGATASGMQVTHIYEAVGKYIVGLTVQDDVGEVGRSSTTITVSEPEQPEPENPEPENPNPTPTPPDPTPLPNQAPVVVFNAIPATGAAPLTVFLDASASEDVDSSISSYAWDLGDGNTAAGVSIEHIYTDTGSYTVTLTVTDDQGATAQATQTVNVIAETVGNEAPVAVFTAEPTQGQAPLTVVFDGRGSSDVDGSITAYAWTFGDGESAVGTQVEHSYEDGGDYTVTLTVVDDDGAIGTATADITVTAVNQAPIAAFTLAPAEGEAPLTVALTVAFDGRGSSDVDGSITTYAWDFGDGSTATGEQVNHEFTVAGDYTVTLTVTDDTGVSTSVEQVVTVREAQVTNRAPTVTVAATPSQGDAPLEVVLVATASDPDGDALSFAWDLGDGGRREDDASVSYSYASPGTFTATVTVTDGRGGQAEASVDVTVNQVATNLQYAGTWRWLAQSFDGGNSYAGYVTINAADEDNANARNIELGSWYYCGSSFDTCPTTPTGTGIIADFATGGVGGFAAYSLGVSFIIGTSDVRLSILDEDGRIGDEFAAPSIQGSGIWQDPNGAQTFIAFGMSRLPAGETFP
jgi:PKD repeat protein